MGEFSIFRRSIPKADESTNVDGQPSPEPPVQEAPQPSEPRELGPPAATLEGGLKDIGDAVLAAGDHHRRLAREDEAVSNLIQGLGEYVEQISATRSRLEEDDRKLGELCERLEYETTEVGSLRARIEEKVFRIQELLDRHPSG